jgi:hypothetical protein
MGTFNIAFAQRFQPVYSALGLPYAKRGHIVIYIVIWSLILVMIMAAISNLIRKNTKALDLNDKDKAISLFEDCTPLAAAGIMGCVNLSNNSQRGHYYHMEVAKTSEHKFL